MKRKVIIIILVVISSLLFSQNVVKFAIGEWDPYTSSNAEKYGIASEIVTAAFAEVGYKVEFEFFPWKRAFELAKEGSNYIGTFPWSLAEGRDEFFYINSDPIIISKNCFFHRKDVDFKYKDAQGLTKYVLGHTRGYTFLGIFEEARKLGIEIDEADSDVINFRKLLKGRIEAFDCDFQVGYSILAKEFSEAERMQITNYPVAIAEDGNYLYLSKKNPKSEELMKKFEEGFKKIKANGKYDSIVD